MSCELISESSERTVIQFKKHQASPPTSQDISHVKPNFLFLRLLICLLLCLFSMYGVMSWQLWVEDGESDRLAWFLLSVMQKRLQQLRSHWWHANVPVSHLTAQATIHSNEIVYCMNHHTKCLSGCDQVFGCCPW